METRPQIDGKRIWRMVYPFLTYYGITLLISMIASLIISMNVMNAHMDDLMAGNTDVIVRAVMEQVYTYSLELQAAAVVLALPFMVVYYQRDRKRRLQAGIVELLPERSPLWMLLIVVFGAITAYAGNGMISLSGLYQVSDSYDEVAAIFYQGKLVLEIVALGILTPILEELIFRGLMYRQLTEVLKKKTAIIVAALLFGGFHGNLLQMIYGTALGLLMIYVYERFNTILAPILFHIGANLLGVLLSETTALSFLYSSVGAMYGSVIISSLLIIGVVWVIERRESMGEMHDTPRDN
ncbi:MAG: CPBP family intramembrane metalloprotease [Lachnospiraceae bacterium]|nr:CPBP family intramembrane metalloprotease [Lachnospiraceae bacterium]